MAQAKFPVVYSQCSVSGGRDNTGTTRDISVLSSDSNARYLYSYMQEVVHATAVGHCLFKRAPPWLHSFIDKVLVVAVCLTFADHLIGSCDDKAARRIGPTLPPTHLYLFFSGHEPWLEHKGSVGCGEEGERRGDVYPHLRNGQKVGCGAIPVLLLLLSLLWWWW